MRAVLLLLLATSGCSDGGDGPGGADAGADRGGEDAGGCALDCGGLEQDLPYDAQAALPLCEDNEDWSQPPEILTIERDDEGRVIHWEVTLRYGNGHLFVVRYDIGSFCPDGSIEEMVVEAESYDPLGTWSCNQFFICA